MKAERHFSQDFLKKINIHDVELAPYYKIYVAVLMEMYANLHIDSHVPALMNKKKETLAYILSEETQQDFKCLCSILEINYQKTRAFFLLTIKNTMKQKSMAVKKQNKKVSAPIDKVGTGTETLDGATYTKQQVNDLLAEIYAVFDSKKKLEDDVDGSIQKIKELAQKQVAELESLKLKNQELEQQQAQQTNNTDGDEEIKYGMLLNRQQEYHLSNGRTIKYNGAMEERFLQIEKKENVHGVLVEISKQEKKEIDQNYGGSLKRYSYYAIVKK